MRRTSAVATLIAVVSALAVVSPPALGATPRPATGPAVDLGGGDLTTLSTPAALPAPKRLTTGWQKIAVATDGVPASGVGSVVLTTTAASASAPGTILVRAHGSTGAGVTAVTYPASIAATETTIVKLGPGQTIDVKEGPGEPKVSLALDGWIPETAALTVPETPGAQQFAATTTAKKVLLAGTDAVPAGATVLLVAVQTVATKAGALGLATSAPPLSLTFPVGTHSVLAAVAPTDHGIAVLKASRKVDVTLTVLGWAAGNTTVNALAAPVGIADAKVGKSTAVVLHSSQGIPGSAQSIGLSFTAPTSARVRLWTGSSATGTPIADFVSSGGAISRWLSVPTGRRFTAQVTGVPSSAPVTHVDAIGFVDNLGKQQLSYVPKKGTVVLGAGDVLDQAPDGTVTLAPSADPVKAGNHVLIRPPDREPYVGAVTSVTSNPDGTRTVTLGSAHLYDAFADYKAHYDGNATQPVKVNQKAMIQRLAAAPDGSNEGGSIPGLDGAEWSCSGSVDVSQILTIHVAYSGSAYLDISLSDISIDFAARGELSFTFVLLGGASISCSVSATLPGPGIILGTTGLVMKFGGTGSLSASTPEESDGGAFQFTLGERVYISFSVYGTHHTSAHKFVPFANTQANQDGLSASLSVGVFIKIEPLPQAAEEEGDPSGEGELGADASITLSLALTIGPPDPADDPLGRVMRGSKCLDVGLEVTLEFGAELLIPFWPDLSFHLPDVTIPVATLYQGPCWGYSGTITYTVTGTSPPEDSSCTAQYCNDTHHWSESFTRTLVPMAASFAQFYDPAYGAYGSPVSQTYNWQYTENDTDAYDWDPNYGEGPPGSQLVHCAFSFTGSGSGTETLGNTTNAWLIDGMTSRPGGQLWGETGVPYGSFDETTTKTAGPDDYCSTGGTTNVSLPNYDLHAPATRPMLMKRSSIDVTLTGGWDGHPNWGTWSATYALTRADYARDFGI